MTVAELIVHLQKLDGSCKVLVCGYEGGYDDVASADPRRVRKLRDPEGYWAIVILPKEDR